MPFGSEVKFDPYCEFDEIIIDAAASLGTFPPNFRKMRTGWAVVYSLHATKVLGAGEGAIVVCGNSQQATLLRSWGNFGFITDRSSDFIGTNAKMSEVCAAYGLFSLENKEKEKTEWLISQGFVSKHTFSSDWSTFVNSEPKFHPYWIASFENKEKRNSVREKLKMSGIKSAEWWARPLSEQKAFTNTTLINDCRNAKLLSEKHLGLPMYRGIMEEDVIKICDLIDTIT
jgi:dTDP-4-amino-4,6-dideoxygalactose transaminase